MSDRLIGITELRHLRAENKELREQNAVLVAALEQFINRMEFLYLNTRGLLPIYVTEARAALASVKGAEDATHGQVLGGRE